MPEIVGDWIHIPIRKRKANDDVVTLTISRAEGIRALYAKDRKVILTYLFDKEHGWTMENAKSWAESHSKDVKDGEDSTGAEGDNDASGDKQFSVGLLVKIDIQKRTVLGEVLIPYDVDLQGDFEEPDDIMDAAEKFLREYAANVGEMHSKWDGIGEVIQCYTAPCDIDWGKDKEGKELITPQGSWLLKVKIHDDKVWEKVLNGEYTGYSMGYRARREEIT